MFHRFFEKIRASNRFAYLYFSKLWWNTSQIPLSTRKTVLKCTGNHCSWQCSKKANEIHDDTSISSDAEKHGELESAIIFLWRVKFFRRATEKRWKIGFSPISYTVTPRNNSFFVISRQFPIGWHVFRRSNTFINFWPRKPLDTVTQRKDENGTYPVAGVIYYL